MSPAGSQDARRLAARWHVSHEAAELVLDAPFVDLHVDTYIPVRLFGYDVTVYHEPEHMLPGPLAKRGWSGRFFGHLDLPRMRQGGMTAAMWSITTNPFRPRERRWDVFKDNLDRLRDLLHAAGGVRIVRDVGDYDQAHDDDEHAALITIQGGNALLPRLGYAHALPDDVVTAVTLIHLTHSHLGQSSAPLPFAPRAGLTRDGHDLVRSLNEKRIFVDLAHISRPGFWMAYDAHDKTQPLIDTHTGCDAVTPHWRNLTDRQIRAIADTGGVVGVIFEPNFLRREHGPDDVNMIVEHIEHVLEVGGENCPAIGTDYDGAINPPDDVKDGAALPRLVDCLLRRGHDTERIRRILGGNFRDSFARLRPAP